MVVNSRKKTHTQGIPYCQQHRREHTHFRPRGLGRKERKKDANEPEDVVMFFVL